VRAVSNAGPIIHLSWIGRLDLLPALFEEVLVPMAVREEVLRAGPDVPGIQAIRDAFASGWLRVRPVLDVAAVQELMAELDRGESESIVLMRETRAGLLLLDERRGRARAGREGLRLSGTIGILQQARDRGLVPAVTPLLGDLRRYGFHVSAELVEQIEREEERA
jgi:predicted nucleic acid-binding protein